MMFEYLKLMVVLTAMRQCCFAYHPSVITIGAVLSSEEHGRRFAEVVADINEDRKFPGLTFNATYIEMHDNPIRAARDVCDAIIPEQVYTVIVSHPANNELSPVAISFTCGFYDIPVIGITTRESSFSDKNIHESFMRTVAPFSHQTEVWVKMLKHFGFKTVMFIYSSDAEGRAMVGRFQSAIKDKEVEITDTLQYVPGESSYSDLLGNITQKLTRIILLYADEKNAEVIYKDAKELNITGKGYAWIVSEQALLPYNTPVGVLGLQQYYVESRYEDAHVSDAVHVIAGAFRKMIDQGENITKAPSACNDMSNVWNQGNKVLKYMKGIELRDGRTGLVKFDEDGDRTTVAYDVINVYRDNSQLEDDRRVTVGSYNNGVLHMDNNTHIIWPGKTQEKPKDRKIETHLQVVTIEEKPFTYALPLKDKDDCIESNGKAPCPRVNANGETEEMCCSGYAIELLINLSHTVNFTYSLHLASEHKYGARDFHEGKKRERVWNGMVGEVERKEKHLIVAPLTINPERAEVIAFSKPFKYQGLTVLVKKTQKNSNLASFLQPFQRTLWILVCLSVHVVALVLYLLDRFSPFGRYKLAKNDDTEEDALNLSGAVWFAWGVLLNSGIGEGTPRSFSARVLGMVWAGFAMIIVASYTANLAAFLVLDRPEASISGIDDARLRNPEDNFMFATVKDSAVAMYFKRQVELSTMYRTMQERNYDSPEQAIADIRSGHLQAFIWDSSRLEYEAANDCDLVTAGEYFGRSGYGIGLQKDSPWIEPISMAILEFHERGTMEKLDNEWILVDKSECPDKDPSAATLGLTNMAGVFMMVAGGIVMGVFLIFVEIAYKRHRGLKEKELELAKTAADRWRGNIEKRRTLRRTLLQQQMERGPLTNGDSPAKMAATGAMSAAPLRNRQLSAPISGYQPANMMSSQDKPPPSMAAPYQRVASASSAPSGYQPVATNVTSPRVSPSPARNIAGIRYI